MKVKCEYCQNMVEVQPGADKVCPFCGSPLPAAPEPPPRAQAYIPPQPPSKARALVCLLASVLLLGVVGFILRMNSAPGGGSGEPGGVSIPNIKVSDALDAVNEGTIDAGAYLVVIN